MRVVRGSNRFYGERGAATLEFAIILPILLVVLFAIVEFGYAMIVCHTLTGAARDGARRGSLPGADNDAVLAAITNQLSQLNISLDNYTIEFDPVDVATASAGDAVKVTVRINYGNVALSPGFVALDPLKNMQLTGVAVMRKEGFG